MHSPTLLVSGISGQLAQLVMASLLGHPSLVGTTRAPERHRHLASHGVDVRYADFDQPASTTHAFEGADRLLLVSTGAEHCGPRRVAQHRHAISAAGEAGVERLVYTSLLNADTSPLGPIASDHAATEAMLRESGLRHVVLRNAFYMDMLLMSLQRAIATGEWISAAGQGRVAYVTRGNCAMAAAAALRSDVGQDMTHHRRVDITGPDALSGEDVVAIANAVLGTRIRFVPVTKEEVASRLSASGMPPPMAALLAYIDTCVAQGAMAPASDDYLQLTGERATSVEAFLIAHRDTLLNAAST